MNKYNAKRCEIDGHRFMSRAEGARYLELKALERAKRIWGLKLQPKFPLIVKGVKVATFIGDFEYFEPHASGEPTMVVEDVKGVLTPVYRIKKRLFETLYGMQIREITKKRR